MLDSSDKNTIKDLSKKFEKINKDELTGKTKKDATKLKNEIAKKTDPRLPYQKRVTYLIAGGIAMANLVAILVIGVRENQLDITIPFVAIVTFFGTMMLSAQHNHSKEEMHEKHSKGVLRRSIAASVVLVYLISFSAVTFGDFEDKEITGEVSEETIAKIQEYFDEIKSEEGEVEEGQINAIFGDEQKKLIDSLKEDIENELKSNQTILGHFTIMTGIVIAFYFGSKAVESRKDENSEAKPSDESGDDNADSGSENEQLKKIKEILSKNPDELNQSEKNLLDVIKQIK